MKRKYENIAITVFMACSLIFDYISKTKTWEYPNYQIKAIEVSVLHSWEMSLAFALLISFITVVILRKAYENLIRERCFIRMVERIMNVSGRNSNYSTILILGIIINNILGIIYEVNLFYSANLGVMTSRNLFQIVPLICLIYLNRESSYNNKILLNRLN